MRNYETKIYDYVDKKTGQHLVKATTMYAGKPVSAIAKCDPTDTFNLELGTKIALKRLDIKIAKKRVADKLAYAKFCKRNLVWLTEEKCRLKKSMERAEVAALDRKVELKQLESELAELLNNI